MWIPKSPEENENDLRKEALSSARFFFGFVLVVIVVSVKIGYDKWKESIAPIAWSDLLVNLPWIVALSLVIFVIDYYWQKAKVCQVQSQTFVCLACGNSKKADDKTTCQCGGKYVDLNHAKWVEDKKIDKEEI